MASAFGGQRSIQLSYGCVGRDLATRSLSGKLGELLHFAISKTINQMVVDHPDRLHMSVDDRRADEAEAA